jgi:hypothetical protein
MADVTKTVAVQITSSADTGGIDKAKQDLGQLKADVAAFDAKLDGMLNEAEDAGAQTGAAIKGGAVKGAATQTFGLTNIFDVGQAGADAWRVGTQIGSAIARGWESTMDGRSFMAGIFGDYDYNSDPAVQKMISAMDEIVKKLNAKPEAGGIIEWLDQVKQKAMEAADEIEHLANLTKTQQGAENDQIDAARDAEEAAIDADPNLTPVQKAEDKASLEKQRIADAAARKEQERLDAETQSLDQLDVKKQELEAAKQAEAELEKRRNVAAQAAKDAPAAWSQTEEGKSIGETMSNGFPKMTLAKPMPDTFLKNYVARAGEREGLEDLVDPVAEDKAADKAKARREVLESDVNQAENDTRKLRETNTAESFRDAQNTSRSMQDVDAKLDQTKQQEAIKDPTPALEAGANSVSQSAAKAAAAAETMVSKVDSSIATLSNSMESLVQRLNSIEAKTNQLASSVQSEAQASKYA